MVKDQFYCLKSYLGTGLIPIVVKGPTLGNLGYKVDFLEKSTNVRKPLTRSLSNQSICTYFSNTQIVLGPTYEIFRNPKRQQEHPWRNQCVGEFNN